MKRWISLLLCITMLFPLGLVPAFAAPSQANEKKAPAVTVAGVSFPNLSRNRAAVSLIFSIQSYL